MASSCQESPLSKKTLSHHLRTARFLWKWIVLIGLLVVLSIYRYRVTMTSILDDPVEIHGKKKKNNSSSSSSSIMKQKNKKSHTHSPTEDKEKHLHVNTTHNDELQVMLKDEQVDGDESSTHAATNASDDRKVEDKPFPTPEPSKKKKTSKKKKKNKKKSDNMTTTDTTKSLSHGNKNEPTRKKSKRDDTIIEKSTNETKKYKNDAKSKHDATTTPELTTPMPTTTEPTTTLTLPPVQNNNNYNTATSLIPPYNKTKAADFTNSSCLLTNTQWFPSSSNDEWQLRAPRFMILGARHAGTRLVSSHLLEHSFLAPSSHSKQEVGYFSQPTFLKQTTSTSKTTFVWKARQRMYARDYPSKLLKTNSFLITMDATPDYLFYSSTTPTSILCTCPWVKLVVILSNPANRVYESYMHASQTLGWKGSLDDYIRLDMETMERAGWIGSGGNNNNNTTRRRQDAWNLYLSLSTSNDGGPVGRSFYAVQLQEWFRVVREMGRSVEEAFHVIRLEEWMAHSDREYQRLLAFLGLPIESLPSMDTPTLSVSANDYNNMTKEDQVTLTRLKKFFRPYNKRLYKLLGDDWDGCWD